ncbi:MAG: GPW/gp25 family protein [Proteobacteria bacterium]|nr:GPW/gp25 family protein [Pseudomonadota bacterium]
MYGMSANTGKGLGQINHLKQSIRDILTTPIGSRVMRRDYGSKIFEIIDSPTNEDQKTEIYAAVAESLDKWEPRFKLQKTTLIEVEPGKLILELRGVFLLDGSEVTLSDLEIAL